MRDAGKRLRGSELLDRPLARARRRALDDARAARRVPRLRRFDQIQRNLGVARNVLAARLDRLVAEGILEKVLYQERPRATNTAHRKGLDLWPVIVELLRWGDRYAAPAAGPPIVLRHKDCGGELGERRICTRCGEPLGGARCPRRARPRRPRGL